jgi:hypothetical protein
LNLGSSCSQGDSTCKCTCFASLADFDGVAGSGWVPIGDQVLLTASIFLTYMAGVIPVQKTSTYSSGKSTIVEEIPEVGTSKSSGRETDFEGDLKSVWDVVKVKLLDSLDAIKRENTLGSKVLKPKPPQGKPPLSLYAISEGPQLYLLWSCFQKLEEEVSFYLLSPIVHFALICFQIPMISNSSSGAYINKKQNVHFELRNCINVRSSVVETCHLKIFMTNKISGTINSDEWMGSFTQIVREAYQAACTAWLKEELYVENTDSDNVSRYHITCSSLFD